MRRSKVQWLVTLVIVLVFGIFVWSRLQPEKTPPKPEESSAEKEEIPENAIFISRWKYFDSKKKVLPEIEWEEEYEGKLYRGKLKKVKETMDAVGAFFVIYEAWIPEVKEGDSPKTTDERGAECEETVIPYEIRVSEHHLIFFARPETAVETAFSEQKKGVRTEDLLRAVRNTHAMAEVMKEDLERMSREYERR